MMKTKDELRSEYKRLRREIRGKNEKSKRIGQLLKNTPEYRSAALVAFYASLPDEVNTMDMIQSALMGGKRVCLPKISHGTMRFFAVSPHSTYKKSAFGICEPVSDIEILPEEIDLVIVPLLAADKEKYRLGFGGGYYDRFLAAYQGNTIGICFKEQYSPVPLPHEPHDIPLKKIISE